MLARATRSTWLGWAGVGVLGAAIALCAYSLMSSGVVWDPQPGPPWRTETILGDVVGFL